jgi:hypothetical protein
MTEIIVRVIIDARVNKDERFGLEDYLRDYFKKMGVKPIRISVDIKDGE